MPSILFIHENFPAQFGGIARYLAARGWRVVFATAAEHVPDDARDHELLPNVRVVRYKTAREASPNIHPYLRGTEKAVLNGQAFARLGAALNKGGFDPDVIVAHSGWGSGSLARIVWPEARLIQYLEWWYNREPVDQEPTLMPSNREDFAAKALCRNLPFLLDVQSANAILVPTQFQADQMPHMLQPRIEVIHDGIDAGFFRPSAADDVQFSTRGLPDDAPIITYATRGMEPMRGFPQFMEAWSKLQHQRPDLHCVIAGRNRVCYGSQLPEGQSYKAAMLEAHEYDMSRLHFVGHLPSTRYRALLQRSSAHVYLTLPFVLSWSLIEAMLVEAPIVASNTAPIKEVAPDSTVSYVDLHSCEQICEAITQLLGNSKQATILGQSARQHAIKRYSSDALWPQLEAFFHDVMKG